MAPLASDPRQLLVVLDMTRRQALYALVRDITAYMRAQLAQPAQPSPPPYAAEDAACPPPSEDLLVLRAAAVAHLDAWRREVVTRLKDLLKAPDDDKIVEQRRARAQRPPAAAAAPARRPHVDDLIDFGDDAADHTADAAAVEQEEQERQRAAAVSALQALFHPIPTRLARLPLDDRREVLSALLLFLLASGDYSADARVLALHLASALALTQHDLVREETEIATSLIETSTSDAARQGEHQHDASAAAASAAASEQRKKENQASRYWKVGLASVAGAALIGVTGGLAAPVVAGAIGGIMGSVGLGGVASFLGLFWMNGALVGALFGAYGARMTGEMVDRYAREVQDFRFIPLREEWGKACVRENGHDSSSGSGGGGSSSSSSSSRRRRLRVTICANGWLASRDDVTKPFRCLGGDDDADADADAEVFALRYETDALLALGRSLEGLVSSYAWSAARAELLRRAALAAAGPVVWPALLVRAAAPLVDNPFALARNRSDKAGAALADALICRVQGRRPVTLVGCSLGARVAYACLLELARRRAFGLVEHVVLVGAPVPSDAASWARLRAVVAGRLCNVFSARDLVLAFAYRAASLQRGVAGLQAVAGVDGVENVDLSDVVGGHLRYPDLMGRILARCGFPGVRGGDAPMERDDGGAGGAGGEIVLRDEADRHDARPTNTLVDLLDLDDGPAAPSLPPVTPSVLDGGVRPSMPIPSSGVRSGGAGHPPRPPPLAAQAVVPKEETKAPTFSVHEIVGPAAATPSTRAAGSAAALRDDLPRAETADGYRDAHGDGYESDESYVGIQMVDNDEEIVYIEPIPIED